MFFVFLLEYSMKLNILVRDIYVNKCILALTA